MLPNYINRSYAEKKLVIGVVGENSEAADLDVAFETLINQIDPPKDPHRALRELRKTDWQAGENVDDFFYRMKDLALEAKTTMTLACSIFRSYGRGSCILYTGWGIRILERAGEGKA